ncbi:G-protein coupled receptor 4-like [Epinephelus lanceolatus]
MVELYCLMVRNDHVAPIFIINLLISDLIQLWCMIAEVAQLKDGMIVDIFTHIYYFCGEVSCVFMWCIALERYLVIACPLRYCFRRTIKISVVVCVVVWVLPLVFILPLFVCNDVEVQETILTFFCFLPLPLFIFFLGGTLKALSASISVHSDEKRRIVGMLVLVLLIHTLLFLPSIILLLVKEARYSGIYRSLFPVFLLLSPLADLFLYIFMRKGTIDKLLASVCCCKMDRNNINSPAVVMMNTYPQSATGGEGERERETIEGDNVGS